jgi:hypothetical protein
MVEFTSNPKYNPDSFYWVVYDPTERNRITMLFGFLLPIENINFPDPRLKVKLLGRIHKDLYKSLKVVCSNWSMFAFLDEGNNAIRYEGISLIPEDGTFYDEASESYYSHTNVLKFKVAVVDDQKKLVSDVSELSVKNMRPRFSETDPSTMEINGHDSSIRKVIVENNSTIELKLASEGTHNIRIKAILPYCKSHLTHYFSGRKL